MDLSLRVAIPKADLDRLERIVKYHEEFCKHKNAEALEGNGATRAACVVQDSVDTINDLIPSMATPSPLQKPEDQRATLTVQKDTLIEPLAKTDLNLKTAKQTFDKLKVIGTVQKRFQARARKILGTLEQHPADFGYDKHTKEVTIKKDTIEGSDVCLLLQNIFYPVKSSVVLGTEKFLNLLKELNLYKFVKNTKLIQSEREDLNCPWWYIGQ